MTKLTFEFVSNKLLELGYDLLDQDYKNNSTKLTVVGHGGYKFYSSFDKLTRTNPEKVSTSNPYSIENIKTWIFKNGHKFVLLSDEYFNNHQKLACLCLKCMEEYDVTWANMSKGRGCPYCANKKVNDKNNLEVVFPEILIDWDYEKNSLIPSEFIAHSTKKAYWKCHVCSNEWVAEIGSRVGKRKTGCPVCAVENVAKRNRMNHYTFVEKIYRILPSIEIIGEYYNSNTIIKCFCKDCKNTWFPLARSLVSGQGCPKCNTSKGEKKISEFLESKAVDFIPQYKFKDCRYKRPLAFDFYLPNKNILIEYDGELHYEIHRYIQKKDAIRKLEEQKLRDFIKNEYCVKNDIKLIRIPYWEIENINDILNFIV